MRTFLEPFDKLGGFDDLIKMLNKKAGNGMITGCIDVAKSHLAYACTRDCKHKLIVTYNEQRAKQICKEYDFFDDNVMYFPAKDVLFYQADIRGNLLTAERLAAIKALLENDDVTIVTTFDALMNTVTPLKVIKDSVITIEAGQSIDLDDIMSKLVKMGYEKEYQVDCCGQFALRGGILDIFPLTSEMPYRIELWGDEIDTIRSFDVSNQKSLENVNLIKIYPAQETMFGQDVLEEGLAKIEKEAKKLSEKYRKEMKTTEAYRITSTIDEIKEQWLELELYAGIDAYLSYFLTDRVSLLDYFDPENTRIIIDELSRCVESGKQTQLEFSECMKQRLEMGYIIPGQMKELFSYKEIVGRINGYSTLVINMLDNKGHGIEIKDTIDVRVKSVSAYNNSFELLVKDLRKYKKDEYKVVLASSSRSRAKRLAEDLMNEGLNSFYTEDKDHDLLEGQIMLLKGDLKQGFDYPDLKFALISESDIFGEKKNRKKRRQKNYEGEKISQFSDLAIGDYVVHENHGLGIYRGIEQIEVDRKQKDYIKIEYAGGSNLYILATGLDMIQKFASKDSKKPKLNKLGGAEWTNTKGKVRGAVKEIAEDLVKLYATRNEQNGFVYGDDTVWQKEFEELFPYEETDDQLLAIEATKADMQSKKIMDRLICGDVGYGKTEIAIRAAFKAVQENKQVAYLAPTTILASQVYNNFAQRMKDFPVEVDLLCRFKSSSEQKKTIEKLKKGQVDIIIGTHRLLSKDVEYKDLGLLIVDEEQRFGVAHKEKIKQLKTNVDVLTLTATPIPRTLHMSLIGIRDMSVLEEPPMDRLPIQTYVLEYNEEMVREAINRELARNGQVYYVYNKVKDIDEITSKIKALVPDANVAYAHGQMSEKQLEGIMYDFINGEIDILVSTTIIETGLDISNVNTMIIHDADNMGLSQLYQLRGRVGRSNRTAYAFLMYRPNKMLKEVAEKRLAAIKEYSDLGSGFKIAMRDLEIRGAGNLLGAAQSGHMQAVGYDLYCKMLNEAVKEAKGESDGVHFDTSIDVTTDAFIPDSYIPNEMTKLDIYKRIAAVETKDEGDEMVEELIDRFGEPPKSVMNLLRIANIKANAHALYITDINQREKTLKITFYEKAKINPLKIPELIDLKKPALSFTPDTKSPYLSYRMDINSKEKGKEVLSVIESLLFDMQILLA